MRNLRLSAILALAAAALSGTVLFKTSQNVQRAEHQFAQLSAQKSKETQAIRVLRAEWDYLNRPDRLEKLAVEHLGMSAPDTNALLHGAHVLPDPIVPIIPARKPTAPPLHMIVRSSPVSSPSSPSKENPDPAPQSFHKLINDLSKAEGER